MSSTFSRVAGVVSVGVFAGLLTFVVFTQVQGEPGDVEEQYPPATHPLVGFGPEDLPKTPILDAEIAMVDLVERVSVDCSGAAPGLRIETTEELPRDATIRIKTMAPPFTDTTGNLRWDVVGRAEEFTVEGGSRGESIPLSSLLRSNLDGGAEIVSVTIAYAAADGALFATSPEHILTTDLTC